MKVAIDIDDTIADFVPRWLSIYNRDYKEKVKPDDIKKWAITEYVKNGKALLKYLGEDSLYDNMAQISGALEGVEYIRNVLGWRVFFVTARYNKGKIDWLYENQFVSSDNEWVVAHDKSLIDASFLIDDGEHNVKAFGVGGILLKKSWNENSDFRPMFSNWEEIQYYLYTLSKGGYYTTQGYYIWNE